MYMLDMIFLLLSFRYLECIVQHKGDIEKDIIYKKKAVVKMKRNIKENIYLIVIWQIILLNQSVDQSKT